MRVAHFDCFSGLSGDMILGACIDAGVDVEVIRSALDSLGLNIKLEVERVKKKGIAATKANVIVADEKKHRHLPDIERIIASGSLSDEQRELALKIFRKVAEAEAKVHRIPIEKVHFHEVGALDSIADIVGSAVALTELHIDRFTSRAIPTGSGFVKCDHGLMPVPAPATAEILKGIPLASSTIEKEMTTPTGAAIVATVVTSYISNFNGSIQAMGYGAGNHDFGDQPNLLRLVVGEVNATLTDTVTLLETNLDDVSGEILAYTAERLLQAGALDVYTIPIIMKKGRPGVILSVLVEQEKTATMEAILFRETATFGIRRSELQRSKLDRAAIEVETAWGTVRAKRGEREGQPAIVTPEFEECARIARENDVPLREVYDAVRKACAETTA